MAGANLLKAFGESTFSESNEYEDDGRLTIGNNTFMSENAKKTISGGTVRTGVISNMWDGSSSTAFTLRSSPNTDQSHSITFDIQKYVRIKSLFTAIAGKATGTVGWTVAIQYSQDNANWTNVRSTSGSGTGTVYIDSTGDFKARYIKVSYTHDSGTNAGSGFSDELQLYEVQIYI